MSLLGPAAGIRARIAHAAVVLLALALAPAAQAEIGSATALPVRAHPIVSVLSLPASMPTGPAPALTLELRDRGSAVAYVQVRLLALPARSTALTATVGWVMTGHPIRVRWPSGAQLAAGSYRVKVSAHDRHGDGLQRSARDPGEALLSVLAPAPAPPPDLPPPATGLSGEAGVPTPAETAAAGAVFPVAGTHDFGGPENAFGAPRSGYSHQGQDILAAEGTSVLAPLAGSILTTSYQAGGAGYYAVEHTAVGFDFMFAHCQAGSLLIVTGQTVAAGAQLCRAGETGDATTPHLDFEIWAGSWQAVAGSGHPINPLPYLEAWEHDGA